MDNNKQNPTGGRGDLPQINGSRGDPTVIVGLNDGDPPLVNESGGDPEYHLEARGVPTKGIGRESAWREMNKYGVINAVRCKNTLTGWRRETTGWRIGSTCQRVFTPDSVK